MNLLDQLRLKKKRQDQKLKEPSKPTQVERPLSRVLDFFRDRQETRLGVLYSLRSKNQIIEKTELIVGESKKTNVSYII